MKIIFLIAGRGTRLKSITKNIHKSLIKINKVSIIKRLVGQFEKLNVKSKDITFITGYKSHQIKKEFGKKYNYFFYPNYSRTNNLHTLIYAKKVIKRSDTVICFSDIFTTNKVISKLRDKKIKNIFILADLSSVRNGTMKIKSINNKLEYVGKLSRKSSNGNFIGIAKIPKTKINIFKKFLVKSKNKSKKHYYTEILNDLISNREKISIKNIAPYSWTEIDNEIDLRNAIRNKKKIIND